MPQPLIVFIGWVHGVGNNTLLRTIPKVAIDIEGFVTGIYEADMGLINTMRGETHTFSR